MDEENRRSSTDLFKMTDLRQFSVNLSKPRITRGSVDITASGSSSLLLPSMG